MWGTLPIGALTMGLLTLFWLGLTQKLISAPARHFMTGRPRRGVFKASPRIIFLARAVPFTIILTAAFLTFITVYERQKPVAPEEIVEQFYHCLLYTSPSPRD